MTLGDQVAPDSNIAICLVHPAGQGIAHHSRSG